MTNKNNVYAEILYSNFMTSDSVRLIGCRSYISYKVVILNRGNSNGIVKEFYSKHSYMNINSYMTHKSGP